MAEFINADYLIINLAPVSEILSAVVKHFILEVLGLRAGKKFASISTFLRTVCCFFC